MKLLSLKTQEFGALTSRSFNLNGKSAVLYGRNEKGKTAFADAVLASLYGLPRASTTYGKEFYARFGLQPAAQALLAGDTGSRIETSGEAPADMPDFPQELFRALLLVRSGEAQIVSQDKRFTEIFTSRVLGGGEIDIRRAMNELKKIYVSYERNSWHRRWLEEQDRLVDGRRLLQKAGDMEELAQKKLDLSAELESRRRDIEALEAEGRNLSGEITAIKLARLKDLQAQHAQTLKQINELGNIDRSLYMRYSLLQNEIDTLSKKIVEKETLLEEIKRTLDENSQAKAELEAKLNLLSPQGLRDRLRAAETDLSAKEELWEKLSRRRRGPFSGQVLLSALAGGALAYAICRFMAVEQTITLAAGGLGALLCYLGALIINIPSPAMAEAKHNLGAAQEEFQKALEAIAGDWKSMDRAAIRAKMAVEDSSFIALSERHAVMETLIARALSRKAEEDESLLQFNDRSASIKNKLEGELGSLGAKSLSDLSSRIEKLEYLHRMRDDLESQITLSADITRRSLDMDLEKRIREYERKLEGGPAFEQLRPLEEVEAQLSRTEQETRKLMVSREHLHREFNEATDRLSRLEGELGMPAAEIFARLMRAEQTISEISLWRQAAEETFQILTETSRASDDMMKNCIENSAPAFTRMTGGTYTGISLVKPVPFETAAINVRHNILGDKPAEWLSAGACDLLWLAIRLALAEAGYKKPAFMLLDEPLIALDDERASSALDVLAEFVQSGWQLLLLTKDERMAVAAEAHGFDRIDL
jgi:hypothetical protein